MKREGPKTHWRLTWHSVFGAAACFLFAGAVIIAPFEELSAYQRNRIDLFRILAGFLGEAGTRGLLALIFVCLGVAALRGRGRRNRNRDRPRT